MPAGDGGIDRGREKGGAVLFSLNWSWRAKASQEEGRWNSENARAGQQWQLMPLPPATHVTLCESFDPLFLFSRVQIKVVIRLIYFPSSLRDMALSCAVSPRVFTQTYDGNTGLRNVSVFSSKNRTSMGHYTLWFILVTCPHSYPTAVQAWLVSPHEFPSNPMKDD